MILFLIGGVGGDEDEGEGEDEDEDDTDVLEEEVDVTVQSSFFTIASSDSIGCADKLIDSDEAGRQTLFPLTNLRLGEL